MQPNNILFLFVNLSLATHTEKKHKTGERKFGKKREGNQPIDKRRLIIKKEEEESEWEKRKNEINIYKGQRIFKKKRFSFGRKARKGKEKSEKKE